MRWSKTLRAGRQADADGVMVIVSRQACEEAADRIAALTAEVDEDNAEIASLCEAAERRNPPRRRERGERGCRRCKLRTDDLPR